MSEHVILLIQHSSGQGSRTYYDFPGESLAMDHIANLYEIRLAKEHPNAGQIQYRAEDLFRFIDTYKEFVALVYDSESFKYEPRDKEWIKDRLIAHFSGQQTEAPPSQQQQNRRRRR